MDDVLDNAIEMEQKHAKGKFPVYYDVMAEVLTKLGQEIKFVDLDNEYKRMPAVLIVDKEGIIQYAYYGDSTSDNPKIEELLEAVKKIK
jgi:alkyl hydroperoxide reductase subunit AhpC